MIPPTTADVALIQRDSALPFSHMGSRPGWSHSSRGRGVFSMIAVIDPRSCCNGAACRKRSGLSPAASSLREETPGPSLRSDQSGKGRPGGRRNLLQPVLKVLQVRQSSGSPTAPYLFSEAAGSSIIERANARILISLFQILFVVTMIFDCS